EFGRSRCVVQYWRRREVSGGISQSGLKFFGSLEVMVKSSIGIIFLLCLAWSVQSQQPASSWLSDTDRARYDTLRRNGIEALYDLDYEKAGREFREISKLFPNHPAGSQLLAARLWLKTLYDSRRLQTSLYSSSDAFYMHGDDKVDPRIVNEFRTLTREAKRLAEATLK